ncbi:hypothetical protein ACVXG9_08630 [Escherichia coli]
MTWRNCHWGVPPCWMRHLSALRCIARLKRLKEIKSAGLQLLVRRTSRHFTRLYAAQRGG